MLQYNYIPCQLYKTENPHTFRSLEYCFILVNTGVYVILLNHVYCGIYIFTLAKRLRMIDLKKSSIQIKGFILSIVFDT
jgi:hypothetical protein